MNDEEIISTLFSYTFNKTSVSSKNAALSVINQLVKQFNIKYKQEDNKANKSKNDDEDGTVQMPSSDEEEEDTNKLET